MKILTLSNLYPPHYVGGYELRCEVAVKALRARGHTVQVLTSNHGVQNLEPAAVQDGVCRTLRIHGFFGHPWLGISRLRKLELHNNRVLRESVAAFEPDVVHVWNLGGLSKSLCLTLQQLRVPVVFDISDHWIARSLVADVWLDWWNRDQRLLAVRLLRWFWVLTGAQGRWSRIAPTNPVSAIRFPRIYFCSRALRELTAAKGYPVQHGEVIYCPVNTERFCGDPIPASRPLRKLLSVGRLADDKGVMTALKAMATVQGKFGGELHVYGKGDADYTAKLTDFVEQHRLPVFFHAASAAEMPAVYRAHDALLFTSEWEEPFALTPLEAMASGLPVIGTMTGGSKELFRHGENALTYCAGAADELARRILELDGDAAARAQIAAKGQSEVRDRFAEPIIIDQMERYLLESASGIAKNADVAFAMCPHQTEATRFTLDGSAALEQHLDSVCARVSSEVRALVPSSKLDGLLLAGGYGRGEGGVLRTDAGEEPYNDLEFYVFVRGNAVLQERRYRSPLAELGHRLSPGAGLEVEFKVLTLEKLRSARPSMFYYDLMARHRWLIGDDSLLAGCGHHGDARGIPLSEVTRLLMNRCSGLLFSAERLRRKQFDSEAADFVGRNLAKTQLALGDALLAASGQYHWSCRERHRRLSSLRALGNEPWRDALSRHHADGVEFKLHPVRSSASRETLAQQHAELSALARQFWFWLENLRLATDFVTPRQYALSTTDKCPETSAFRNRLINARTFGAAAVLRPRGVRYPRQRLLHSLSLLLWDSDVLSDDSLLRTVQREINTTASDFSGLVDAYQHLWHRFN